MLSPVILVPAILNGLMTGAVYALVALGLTLIYGVLHIINFAHGALLTAAMFAAFFAHQLLGLDPYLAAHRPDAAVLRARLRLAALRHRPGRAWRGPQHPAGDARPRGRHRERAALCLSRRHAHHQPALRLQRRRGRRRRSSRCRASSASPSSSSWRWRCGCSCAGPTPARRSARSPRRSSAPSLSGIDVAHIYAVTFGLGTACLAIAACLLIPTYYVNPHAGNAFVLIAFTIVVLGGMGSVAGALIGGLFVGVVESLSRPLSRRIARPDRHFRDVHPGAAVPPERPVRRARMKGLRRIARSPSRCSRCVPLRHVVQRRCSISWSWRC